MDILSCCKFLIYWVGINTKFTTWVVKLKILYLQPPSTCIFKNYNMTMITISKQSLFIVLGRHWHDKSPQMSVTVTVTSLHIIKLEAWWRIKMVEKKLEVSKTTKTGISRMSICILVTQLRSVSDLFFLSNFYNIHVLIMNIIAL